MYFFTRLIFVPLRVMCVVTFFVLCFISGVMLARVHGNPKQPPDENIVRNSLSAPRWYLVIFLFVPRFLNTFAIRIVLIIMFIVALFLRQVACRMVQFSTCLQGHDTLRNTHGIAHATWSWWPHVCVTILCIFRFGPALFCSSISSAGPAEMGLCVHGHVYAFQR